MLSRLFTRIVLATFLLPTVSAASDANIKIDNIAGLQNAFADLVEDLGAALSYKSLSPAEPLGLTGFDLGFEVSSTKMKTKALDQATDGAAPSALLVPKVHLHKGLPFGIDVGAFMSKVPDSNINLVGGELKYAIISGGTLMPALALRGTYSKLSGVDKLSLSTNGLELSISKGFAMLTPYAGIGLVRIKGDSELVNLSAESLTSKKYFLGLNFNMGLLNFAAETEQTGENATTSAKIGFRF